MTTELADEASDYRCTLFFYTDVGALFVGRRRGNGSTGFCCFNIMPRHERETERILSDTKVTELAEQEGGEHKT